MRLKQWYKLVFTTLIVACLAGCMATEQLVHVPAHEEMATVDEYDTRLYQKSVHIFNPMPIDSRVAQLRLQPRVEHLVLIVDQSSALEGTFRGYDTRFYAREVVRRFVKTMPNKPFSSTIVSYRDTLIPQLYAPLDSRLSISPVAPSELELSLGENRASQHVDVPTLSVALDYVSELVGNLPGSSAVILVTAWSQIDESVEQAVMRMRLRVSFNTAAHVVLPESSAIAWPNSHAGLCFYTIGVGNRMSRSRLESADSCGFSAAVDKVAQPSNMANFVETVLYKGPADKDNDGIYDYQDLCPFTPPGRIVDYSGCPRFQSNR